MGEAYSKLTPLMKHIPENHLSSIEHRWFAIYSRYRCEKMVHEQLTRKQIEAYLPLKKVIRRHGKQRKKVELPLISNYVFVKIIKKEYVPVLETNHVLNYVKFSSNLISIPEEEIDLLKRIVGDADTEIFGVPQIFSKGDLVEITSGSLTGVVGVLQQIKGKNNVVIALKTLGYSLTIEVGTNSISKLEGHRARTFHQA